MRLRKGFSNLELEGQGHGIIIGMTHTSARAILHHTEQKGSNILMGRVQELPRETQNAECKVH